MPIKVLLLTQWFDPEPTFKGLVFARELVRQGFEVEVVTGFPNYPGGRVYPGYKIRLIQKDVCDGVQVTRLPLYPSHNQSAFGRVLNYASFAASSAAYGLFFARRPDVVYAYHPPLSVGIAACLMRVLRRTPVVYDVQDMWPDTLAATGMVTNKRVLNVVSLVCRWVYRKVDRLVVLSPGFKTLLTERGVPPEKIDVVYNWADEQSLGAHSGALPSQFPGDGHFRIVYAGNMGKAQALQSVLDAAALLQTRKSRVVFVFVGAGTEVEVLRRASAERSLTNVVFFPPVPMAQVGAYLDAADALLVHLRDDPLFQVTIPSKTQAYMRIGKPILMAVRGNAAELVARAAAGVAVEPENPAGLAAAAESLASTPQDDLKIMGANAKAFYEEHLALKTGVSRFASILSEVGS